MVFFYYGVLYMVFFIMVFFYYVFFIMVFFYYGVLYYVFFYYGVRLFVSFIYSVFFYSGVLLFGSSFIMVFSKFTDTVSCRISVHGQAIVQVSPFLYLSSQCTSDGKDVRRRICISKSAFLLLERILSDRNIDPTLRIRILKYFIWM